MLNPFPDQHFAVELADCNMCRAGGGCPEARRRIDDQQDIDRPSAADVARPMRNGCIDILEESLLLTRSQIIWIADPD